MPIEVFRDFELLDMIYSYSELAVEKLFRGSGDFKLKLQSLNYSDSLAMDNIVMINNEAYFINYITKYKNLEKQQIFETKGSHINSLLERRILISPYTITSNQTYEYHISQLLNQNIINPSDNKRKISNFIFEATNYLEKPAEDFILGRQSLLEAVNLVCEQANIGYNIIYDVTNQSFIFKLSKGRDKTNEVIFSEPFNNIANSEVIVNNRDFRNVCYNSNNSVGDAAGLERREAFTDSDKIEEAKKILLENKIKENVNSEILNTEQFEYKKDWDLGDTVTFIDKGIGFIVEKPVMAIREIYSDRYTIEVDFGEKIPILSK